MTGCATKFRTPLEIKDSNEDVVAFEYHPLSFMIEIMGSFLSVAFEVVSLRFLTVS